MRLADRAATDGHDGPRREPADDTEEHFACTNGGPKKLGQVFRYTPSPFEGSPREEEQPGQLELFIESEDEAILKSCDNLTVSPWGDVMLCEDDPHPFLRGVTPEGRIYTFAENIGHESELAGVCFSPSGKTMFVNIQHAGLTLAITGPWMGLAEE